MRRQESADWNVSLIGTLSNRNDAPHRRSVACVPSYSRRAARLASLRQCVSEAHVGTVADTGLVGDPQELLRVHYAHRALLSCRDGAHVRLARSHRSHDELGHYRCGAMVSVSLSTPTSHHGVLLFAMVLVLLLLVIEARRYRFFDVYRARVRLLERQYFARLFGPDGDRDAGWMRTLSNDLQRPVFLMGYGLAFSAGCAAITSGCS